MNVRYSYHKDPRNPRRVLATIRQWEKGDPEVSFAFAVCNPLDQFSKKKAHLMLLGRLKKHPVSTAVAEGQPPLEAVLIAIANTPGYRYSDIARSSIRVSTKP